MRSISKTDRAISSISGPDRWSAQEIENILDYVLMEYGLVGLGLVSFLAATLIPLGSEWLLVALLLQGQPPLTVVSVATLGNTLGALTTWAIGVWGGPWIIRRLLRMDEDALARARQWYRKFGIWSLFLAWLPVVGDPLCLVAGLMRVSALRFIPLVLVGKGLRYGIIAASTLRLSSI